MNNSLGHELNYTNIVHLKWICTKSCIMNVRILTFQLHFMEVKFQTFCKWHQLNTLWHSDQKGKLLKLAVRHQTNSPFSSAMCSHGVRKLMPGTSGMQSYLGSIHEQCENIFSYLLLLVKLLIVLRNTKKLIAFLQQMKKYCQAMAVQQNRP